METNKALTLRELNTMVREAIECELDDTYCVKAELSEVRISAKGHCFIELIEKSVSSQTPVAKARGVIMAGIFELLKLDFEETTGQEFTAGLQVMLEVRPSFSEIYGYSLVVTDIDPSYTLGDMAKRRQEILNRLERDGVLHLQKELELPPLIQRIAIISSATAAGYGDFCHQLDGNTMHLKFVHKLFPATMQGNDTERSIIAALDSIASEQDNWDVVVIIRGGGAVSDLSGFETYDLANNCVQFPLPIITGIGHQRDMTVLDYVVRLSLKTPTAVSDFLIEQMEQTAQHILNLETRMQTSATRCLEVERQRFESLSSRVNLFAQSFRIKNEARLDALYEKLLNSCRSVLVAEHNNIDRHETQLGATIEKLLTLQHHKIEITEQKLNLYNPQRILNLGYSLTFKDGCVLRNIHDVAVGDTLVTRLADGEIHSIVK